MIDEKRGFKVGKGCVDQIFIQKQIGEKVQEIKCRIHVDFMDFLENTYDRVNKEVVWQVLRMYNVASKLLNGIKNMNANSLAC